MGGLKSIKMLSNQVDKIEDMGGNLKGGRSVLEQSIDSLKQNIDKAVNTIKTCEKISKSEIDKIYKSLVDQINKELVGVKRKIEQERIAEEQEKLRKLQQEIEEEKNRKQDEELLQK